MKLTVNGKLRNVKAHPMKYKPFLGASVSPTGITEVTKTRSRHAIGDDHP